MILHFRSGLSIPRILLGKPIGSLIGIELINEVVSKSATSVDLIKDQRPLLSLAQNTLIFPEPSVSYHSLLCSHRVGKEIPGSWSF